MNMLPLTVVRGLYDRPVRTPGDHWRDHAECRGTDTDSFYPGKGESAEVARKICRRCSVSSECLAYAMRMADPNGIWGGVPEGERRKMLRRAA